MSWSAEAWERTARRVEGLRDEMIDLQKKLCAIPALSPAVGGEGELAKEQFLLAFSREQLGTEQIEEVNAPDPEARSGVRPSLALRWKGQDSSRTLWFLTHTDVVPPGDLSAWRKSPWEAFVEDGRIIGRGVEDNQQSV